MDKSILLVRFTLVLEGSRLPYEYLESLGLKIPKEKRFNKWSEFDDFRCEHKLFGWVLVQIQCLEESVLVPYVQILIVSLDTKN